MDAPSAAIRRTDKVMPEAVAHEVLERGFCGRLSTVGPDGWPYIVPLLYIVRDGAIWVHNTAARGHLRVNVDHEPRVCFEVDEPGQVFPYGRFECDTTVEYRSVVIFGRGTHRACLLVAECVITGGPAGDEGDVALLEDLLHRLVERRRLSAGQQDRVITARWSPRPLCARGRRDGGREDDGDRESKPTQTRRAREQTMHRFLP